MFNFDRITVQDLQGRHRPLEGLKAGEFDVMRRVQRAATGRGATRQAFESGELIKREFDAPQPAPASRASS
jgi:hypothetical protein